MLDLATTLRLLVHIFGTSRHPALSSVMTFETDLMAAERLRAMMHKSVDAIYNNEDVPINQVLMDDVPLNFGLVFYDNEVVPTGPVLIDDAPLKFGPEVFEITYTEKLDGPIIDHGLSINDNTGIPLVEKAHVLYILIALVISLYMAFQLGRLIQFGKGKRSQAFSSGKFTVSLPPILRWIIVTLNLYTWHVLKSVSRLIYLAFIVTLIIAFAIRSSILGGTGLVNDIEISGHKTLSYMLNGTYTPSVTGDVNSVFWQILSYVTLVFPGLAVTHKNTLSCIVSETDTVLAPFFPAFVIVALDFVYKMMSIDAQDTTSMLKGKESQGYISTENEECTTDATWTDDSIWLNYYDSSATESTMSIYTECPTDATWTDDCIWYDYYDSSMTKSTTPIYEEHATDVTWTDDSFWLDYYDSSATGFSASNNATSFDSGEDAKPWKKTKRGCRAGRKIQARKARQATEPEPEPAPTSAVSATCPSASEEADVPETV